MRGLSLIMVAVMLVMVGCAERLKHYHQGNGGAAIMGQRLTNLLMLMGE